MKQRNNIIKASVGETLFNIFNIIFFVILMLVMVYPLWHVLCASLSDSKALIGFRGLILTPMNLSFEAYRMMGRNPMILRGYVNTIIIVTAGVFINILLTSIGAYFLSRKKVFFKNVIMLLIVFTMYFSGGLIPFYFTVSNIGLANSLWALILPGAVNTFNLIIMRTSFMSIPDSMDESARIDGAGHLTILFRIVLPLSKAVLAVIALYYAVGHWNSWFNAMLFLNDRKLFPLQMVLREILIQNDTSAMMQNINTADQLAVGESIKYAVIVAATLPVVCIYPFIQKYFVKGVMVGALKG